MEESPLVQQDAAKSRLWKISMCVMIVIIIIIILYAAFKRNNTYEPDEVEDDYIEQQIEVLKKIQNRNLAN